MKRTMLRQVARVAAAEGRGAGGRRVVKRQAAWESGLTFGVKADKVHDRRDERMVRDSANVIRVRADTKTASLSGWLTSRLRESKEPLTMTTIGMTGLNQIIKSLCVAQELVKEEGLVYCRASKAETVTERGSPASYFAIHVSMRPPTDSATHQNVAPNRVGKSSHPAAILQICESTQKIGQACVLSVAGPESVQKAVICISSLHRNTEFIPVLVKNEEGEYTAMHLRILPLPGAPKVVFVSKYTKPNKLAGYLRHVFKDENGAKIVKVVASVDSHEAIRAAAKACESATDYLEVDRIPLTMNVEVASDEDALSSGSYVFTLTRELPKETTAQRVTVGLGNLSVDRVIEQIRSGVMAGRLVHLRSTLQGVPTCLQALSTLSETLPLSFYSRPKEVSFGPNNEQLTSPQMDRFFVEYMVEKMVVPETIDYKGSNSLDLLQKAVKLHQKFSFYLRDIDHLTGALRVLQELVTGCQGRYSLRVTAEPSGIGMIFSMVREKYDDVLSVANRAWSKNLRFQDGVNSLGMQLQAITREQEYLSITSTNRVQTTQLFRALGKKGLAFYIVPSLARASDRRTQLSFILPRQEPPPEPASPFADSGAAVTPPGPDAPNTAAAA
eukprot:TRINITY_DN8253_c0_g1_i1.p1 TRINITY_DN8253_c0_g1~~TRINITY_DN8253_c0_g1_i1.p1  ORF type:complete len:614 (+),score=230.65 TRINITY_DN8253_c0_g1_i1:82-1923(+)